MGFSYLRRPTLRAERRWALFGSEQSGSGSALTTQAATGSRRARTEAATHPRSSPDGDDGGHSAAQLSYYVDCAQGSLTM